MDFKRKTVYEVHARARAHTSLGDVNSILFVLNVLRATKLNAISLNARMCFEILFTLENGNETMEKKNVNDKQTTQPIAVKKKSK